MDRGLPVGIYDRGTSFKASVWETGGNLVWQKCFKTQEEAEYQRQVYMHGHHWVDLPDNAMDSCFGFIYRITNRKTNKQYIGSKQFYKWAGPVGGYKCTDPLDEVWWDKKAWTPNDWEFYTGSQNDLNAEIAQGNVWDFKYECVSVHRDKLSLHIAEITLQQEEDVLEAVDSEGNYLYYNKNIASKLFRAPFRKVDVLRGIEATMEAARKYYLKPNVCGKCGKALQYGTLRCCP